MERDSMQYDVLIIGGGPAGLAAAIKLKQLSPTLTVCIVEKGSEIGAHILSGAVMEPRALNELIPNWQTKGAPLTTPVSQDKFLFLTQQHSFKIPRWILPQQLHNNGNYVVSLANVCRWLAEQAISLGVEIYPGFAAAQVLYHENGRVIGIRIGDKGIAKDGSHCSTYTEGIDLFAKYTLFAEGCRGYLSQQLMKQFNLRNQADPQTYGIGIKELWEIDPKLHQSGLVQHTVGWPLDRKTYGGSFIYHLENNQISLGFVIGLDYENTYLNPYEEMQRFKTHPVIRNLLIGGRRIAYGARAVNEGGLQSIPKLTFPGGALIGCAAGFLNVAKIKGSHNAMKSAMLAAEAIVAAIQNNSENGSGDELVAYERALRESWVYQELYQARNFRAYFRRGLITGTLLGGIDLKLGGNTPWTLHHTVSDRFSTKKANECRKINYPKHDGVITFDLMSSVFLANTKHDENQPSHLHVKDPQKVIAESYVIYDFPEQRYCPAGVYEMVTESTGQLCLQINAANCVHCKTCDIKDPTDNIIWVVPEGGSGPNYPNM